MSTPPPILATTRVDADLHVGVDHLSIPQWRAITAERDGTLCYIDADETDWDGAGLEIGFPTPGLGEIADRQVVCLPLSAVREWLAKVDAQLAAEKGSAA